MKRRRIRTTKLLAVALGTTAAACSPGAGSPAKAPDEPAVVAVGDEVPPAEEVAPSGSDAAPTDNALAQTADDGPAEDVEADGSSEGEAQLDQAALEQLRNELSQVGREGARDQKAKFRPLCDADGYPLVGNVVRKSPDDYQPSQFCEDLRSGD